MLDFLGVTGGRPNMLGLTNENLNSLVKEIVDQISRNNQSELVKHLQESMRLAVALERANAEIERQRAEITGLRDHIDGLNQLVHRSTPGPNPLFPPAPIASVPQVQPVYQPPQVFPAPAALASEA